MVDERPQRRIRSFVRREGRLTQAQQRALDELFPRYGVEQTEQLLDFHSLFGRDAARVVEIGFGNGRSLATMAASMPEKDFLGIEVHRPGVGSLLQLIEEKGLTNIRVICADAVEVLKIMIPDDSLDMFCLYFPDPWPKRRHHKRRILQPDFVQLLRSKLKTAAIFHCATDWQNYAEQMMAVMSAAEGFGNISGAGEFSPRPDYRPLTKFEQRGQRLGHGVWDLMFTKTD